MTLSITTFRIKTLRLKGLFIILSIRDTVKQESHYAECLHAKCPNVLIVMRSVVMLNVGAPSVHLTEGFIVSLDPVDDDTPLAPVIQGPERPEVDNFRRTYKGIFLLVSMYQNFFSSSMTERENEQGDQKIEKIALF
jgi:hypothetical protein